ncbi:MAG: RecQ family ATP-dependent DNA helicase, partial [Planctomycetota bacterium]
MTIGTAHDDRLLALLERHWGYDSFRPLQREAVEHVLGGGDCLLVLPTGGGKSMCYQLPAVAAEGCALVLSPLIALMDDQVAAARENGLRAIALHSGLDPERRRAALQDLRDPALDLVYVSPERFCFGDLLQQLESRLRLIAIDEAHCISHWGHDFRPEYRQLAPLLQRVASVPRLALTATATPQVQDDICRMLELRRPARLVGHIDRPNLRYRCWPRRKAIEQILQVVREHPGEGGIVYAHTRRSTETLAEKLRARGCNAAAYHAGMRPDERALVQREFVAERIDVVCATIAFGMGIDRSNVRFVIHHNVPKSIEHYQQESGRAGRDGAPADCVLLASAGDMATQRALAAKDGPLEPDRMRAMEEQLRAIGRFAVAPVCRHELLCRHFGQEYAPPGQQGCGACDVCLGETDVLDAAQAETIARKILSGVWRCKNRFGTGHVIDLLRGADTEKIRRAETFNQGFRTVEY